MTQEEVINNKKKKIKQLITRKNFKRRKVMRGAGPLQMKWRESRYNQG